VTDKQDEAAPDEADIPPTRKHGALPDEPPARDSHLSIEVEPAKFPDDGALSQQVRRIDHYLGIVEQGILFGLLAAVVLVAALAAVHDKLTSDHLGRWWHYIVRGGTFTIAMIGAVFATHQQRHLAMDLISRRISPRARLVLGSALKLFTIAIAMVLFRSGMHQRAVVGGQDSLNLLGLHITDSDVVTMMPVGAALIILHSVLHILIDVEYLVRGKLPPERARSGH
jgi:TRAP-type mannitol/chloroaromatic compound transport system permease small subunit